MTPIWEASSEKHGVPREDQIHAILHANYQAVLDERGTHGGSVVLYVGPPHLQTDREVEVLVEDFAGESPSRIFHAMPLGPKFRRYREEHPHD